MSDSRKPLHRIFSAVPPSYDSVNRVITLGLDARWRKLAAKECLSTRPSKILDACCGTGDLALSIASMANNDAQIVGLDYSEPMLEIAAEKAITRGLSSQIEFQHGDVSELPFQDAHFDCVGISFAFRNITYKNPMTSRYLAEIYRVIRPGGRLVIVESSQPRSAFIRFFFHRYLRWYVYHMGFFMSSQKGAYRYLAESAANYYSPDELMELLSSVGFRDTQFQPLLLGAAGICVAVK